MSFAGDGTYVGISGQRPTAGIGSGTRFIDRATGDDSYFDGSVWKQTPRSVFSGAQITGVISGSPVFQGVVTFSGGTSPAFQLSGSAAGIRSPHDYLIYKNSANATVYCLDSDGDVVTSSTTQEAPLQVALSSGLRKSIYVTAGTYNLSAGFTGFNFTQVETKLIMDPGALINVPNGYSGAVFTYHAPVSVTQTIGGRISEQGTPASLWTAYHLLADTSGDGVNSNRISDGYIRYANKVIHLHTNHATGWVNSNSIQNIFADRFVHGIYFDEEVAPTGSNGTNANVFYNIILQAHPTDPQTLNGVRGITGADNQFYAVMVWDLFDPGVSANVTSGADNTLIVGGAMCHLNYTNFGVDTHVFEQSAGLVTDKLTLANKSTLTRTLPISSEQSGNFAITQAPLSGSSAGTASYTFWNHDQTERIYIERSTTNSISSRRQGAAGTMRPLVFQMIDGVATTSIEGARLDISGNFEFNRSGGTVQFFSGNTSLTRTETAARSGAFAPLGFLTVRLGTSNVKVPYFST